MCIIVVSYYDMKQIITKEDVSKAIADLVARRGFAQA
jgi:hypothetical protein